MVGIKKKIKKYRIRSKMYHLTYRELPKDVLNLREQALGQFKSIFGLSHNEFKYLIKEEMLKDTLYLQVFLKFESVQEILSPIKLDLKWNGIVYKGEYKSVQSKPKCFDNLSLNSYRSGYLSNLW